jgi:hypothetical protein
MYYKNGVQPQQQQLKRTLQGILLCNSGVVAACTLLLSRYQSSVPASGKPPCWCLCMQALWALGVAGAAYLLLAVCILVCCY